MKLSDFDYELPKELIAQEPATPRDSSRLMVVDRKNKTIEHKIFRDIVDFLDKDDLLVINNAKVFPARLLGKKETTGGKIDLLLVEEIHPAPRSRQWDFTRGGGLWKCLIQGSGKIRKGLKVIFGDNKLKGTIEDYDKGMYLVRFTLYQSKLDTGQTLDQDYSDSGFDFEDILEEIGEMPLPPYIKEASASSKKRYQTVYAKKTGAIAAPTAGFHFTEELLERLKAKGISVATITLMVGRGTFNPIKTEDVEKHLMDEEYFEFNEKEKQKINTQLALNRDCSGSAPKNKGRIIAVGTTSVRTLESVVKDREIIQTKGKTSLFIHPGYRFKAVNSLITNFHWPKSTPLLLTCAFGGRELILRAYKEAIVQRYRFYSFGDAMMIL